MNTSSDILSFMDILGLGEEIVDSKLKSIMSKTNFSNKNLTEALGLLNYKYLVNIQENTECENDIECDFIVKLIKNVDETVIDNICKIIKIVLLLNKSTIVSKCEHLLQQLLTDLSLTSENEVFGGTLMMNLKICCSILDAVLESGENITLLFIETPLEKVLDSIDEKLKIYFLTNIVPKFIESVYEYNILDRIWNHIRSFEGSRKSETLKILSCLSDYYLHIEGSVNKQLGSGIINEYEFWNTILYGLENNDISLRKISIYLAKRAIEIVVTQKKSFNVSEFDTIFRWDYKNALVLKSQWENYFILIESLEEQQSNIVLPSLQLFDVLKDFNHKWLTCAFNIALTHDNSQVKMKSIEKRLKLHIHDTNEAKTLLEALNDINIYELQNNELKNQIIELFKHKISFINIFKIIPSIKWSPIPLYYLSDALAKVDEDYSFILKEADALQVIKDIIQISCNNVIIRKAVHINVSTFIGNCFKSINWKDYIDVYSYFKFPKEIINGNAFVELLKTTKISDDVKQQFYDCITNSHKNVEICVLYLKHHEEDLNIIMEIINKMITNIQNVMTKQYSDKLIVYKDVLYLLELHAKTRDNNVFIEDIINKAVGREMRTILQYISNLFCIDRPLAIEDINLLFKTIDVTNICDKELLLNLYKTAVLFIKDETTELDKKILGIFAISTLHDVPILNVHYKHELLDIKSLTDINIHIQDTDQSVGRLRNAYYEKICEIVYKCLKEDTPKDMTYIKEFIEMVTECGGYGCLKWILRIVNKTLTYLVEDNDFDIKLFMSRMWNEIEELKSNNQYNICIKEFIVFLTQDVLLQKSEYNNVILSYYNKIIDLGQVKTTPLFYLVEELNDKEFEKYGQLVCVLCDILLYCPILRRDQRIADNIAHEILRNPKYGINSKDIATHFTYEIQFTSITILSKITDDKTIETIIQLLIKKLDDIFRSKQRYHGNSQTHKTLLTALQHLILILLLNWERRNFKRVSDWCIEFLGRLPHQPSVKMCLEWYIALYYYVENLEINQDVITTLKSKNVPLISQFYILYWFAKHKLRNQSLSPKQYEFILDLLLSHTMGQMFNVRLHAQYMASKLHAIKNNKDFSAKYDYIVKVIEATFEESRKDKTFMKLQDEYFANDFDIIKDLNPAFIYYVLPKYFELYDVMDVDYIKSRIDVINSNISMVKNDFKAECMSFRNDFESYNKDVGISIDNMLDESVNEIRTIQKKYIPWKNMSNVNVYEVNKKKETTSELIVVASLIDKLPNLGGMARTSEVFGVKTYVVDSLRHLQDRQFQGLSVSAERWIDVEEVRPGRMLKEYLAMKKSEGYSVVAAEQTSTSCKLQSFKFPKKTLLLLGHEKEGIPCDLLPLMDHCVEIPQQGFVRSLNVHVTAAIFAWEYSRQNIL